MNRRSLTHLLLFTLAAITLALAGGSVGLWQSIDHLFFRVLYLPEAPVLDSRIRLIDIEYPEELRTQEQPTRYRETLGKVLHQLAALPDRLDTVLVDIWFSSNPTAEGSVISGMEALHKAKVKIYVTVNPRNPQGPDNADFMQRHNAAIYSRAVDGYGHTQLDYAFNVLKYDRELVLPVHAGGQRIGESHTPALPIVATTMPEQAKNLPPAIVIPAGDDSVFKDRIHHVSLAQGTWTPPFPAAPATTHVIVGSLKEDSNFLGRPGPLLLAWALSDQMAKTSTARQPINHPAALLGLSALAALCTAGVLALSFRMVRGKVVPSRWRRLASGLAVLAFMISSLLLLVIGGIVLLAEKVIPVGLPLACAALASGFMRRSALRWIDNERTRAALEHDREERAIQYDVFISYAHDPPENKAWVKQQVYKPIAALRHPNGEPLRVFFDESEIEVGDGWKKKIELSMLGSRFFIPVYSDIYFDRPYCRHEVEIGDHLRIEHRLTMLPVARTLRVVPERYSLIPQILNVQVHREWQTALLDRITVGLASDMHSDSV
jgi:hypothetical protein